jgi:polyhydroxyalkanoate synthase
VNGYLDNIVDFIRRRHDLAKINLMGICMGGTFCVMYAALHPEKIKNLITTVTPTNFDTDKGLLHVWMKDIDADRMIRTFGNIPGDLMNFGFLLLNPARLMIDKYVGFLENMDSRDFVENFVRMERWIFDSPDVPGETFRQFVEDCYQKNLLIRNQLMLGGKRVDLKKLTMPLLNFFGEYDHLVPPPACDRLVEAVGSSDAENVCLETGHIGIYVSSKFQRQFAPRIARWLKERDEEEPALAAAAAQPSSGQKPQTKPGRVRSQKAAGKKNTAAPAAAGTRPARPPRKRRKTTASKSRSLLMQKIAEAI